jgi:hypothetical protein
MNTRFKLGRQERKFNPNVKTLKAFFKHQPLPDAPATADWTDGKTDFGMMLNDELGCCTCAAIYHARQVWTMNTSAESTEPDGEVLGLYEKACGYVLLDDSTDQGGSMQDVLEYCMKTGMQLSDGSVDKLLGFVEFDQTKMNEVKLAVSEFGVANIGIDIPKSVWGADGEPLAVWDYVVGSPIAGGHDIVAVGYDDDGLTVISWGSLYKMTWAFYAKYCDEGYAMVDKNWVESTGKTPLGVSLGDLEEIMKGL